MKTGITSDTAKSAKTLAQQIAKQIAQEPLEVLKTAKEQTVGGETLKPSENLPQSPQADTEGQKLEEQKKQQDKMKSQRLYEAMQRELTDIEHQKVLVDLQGKIAAGEIISLEEYPELSETQKEILSKQMESVQGQIAEQKKQAGETLPVSTSKPSRRMGSTRKQEAEKQQQRVEKPVPPSG